MHLWLHLDVKICQKVLAEIDLGICGFRMLGVCTSHFLLTIFWCRMTHRTQNRNLFLFFSLFFLRWERFVSRTIWGAGDSCEKKKALQFSWYALLITYLNTGSYLLFLSLVSSSLGSFLTSFRNRIVCWWRYGSALLLPITHIPDHCDKFRVSLN